MYSLYANETNIIDTRTAQTFQEEFDEKYFEINQDFEKLRHILLHLIKTTGKMATYCEVKEHGKTEPDASQLMHEVLPDLLIHALQIANYYDIDLGEEYKKRIEFIIRRSTK
jgi:NTP pyrophosphatase (non-canonical NTP hydrolase)